MNREIYEQLSISYMALLRGDEPADAGVVRALADQLEDLWQRMDERERAMIPADLDARYAPAEYR